MDEPLDPQNPTEHPDETARRLGLAELADAAGVSIRTVRYYIAEGLVPPPEGAGPRSAYTTGHLDRLRLIARLKDAYLPLREIRRRLDGLDDAAVRGLLARLGPPSDPRDRPARSAPTAAEEPPPDSAADYLARVMMDRPAASPASPPRPGRLPRFVARASALDVEQGPRRPEQESEGAGATAFVPPSLANAGLRDEPVSFAPDPDPDPATGLDPALAVVPPAPEPVDADEGAWRRILLGPDAELLVREDAYRRRRDRVDWLVRWARKVFG